MGCVKFVHYAFTDHILNIKNDLFDSDKRSLLFGNFDQLLQIVSDTFFRKSTYSF